MGCWQQWSQCTVLLRKAVRVAADRTSMRVEVQGEGTDLLHSHMKVGGRGDVMASDVIQTNDVAENNHLAFRSK